MSRHTRATTVVSQPPRFSTALVSERLSRSHASCTASSASLSEPSIRYATERRWTRCASNCPGQVLAVVRSVTSRRRGLRRAVGGDGTRAGAQEARR